MLLFFSACLMQDLAGDSVYQGDPEVFPPDGAGGMDESTGASSEGIYDLEAF